MGTGGDRSRHQARLRQLDRIRYRRHDADVFMWAFDLIELITGPLGIRFSHEIELIRPENLAPFIANMNARPSIAHEIGGLEHGSYGGITGVFRMAAARMFTVDGKWHWTHLSWLARDANRVCSVPSREKQSYPPASRQMRGSKKRLAV
jgi:hypothetical protein